MAIKAIWKVQHSCGHSQDHDLSDRRVSERASFARWLSTRECSACFRASRDRENGQDKEAWLAERRAVEAVEIEAWEQKAGMPPLSGSEKQVQWGRRARHDLLTAAHESWLAAGRDDDEFALGPETQARMVARAGWWVDQRDSGPEDLPELVADAAASEGLENPW